MSLLLDKVIKMPDRTNQTRKTMKKKNTITRQNMKKAPQRAGAWPLRERAKTPASPFIVEKLTVRRNMLPLGLLL